MEPVVDMTANANTVEAIFESVSDVAENRRHVTVEQLVQAMGHRGYGPFLLVPALLEISPLGAIPAVPTVLAVIISIFAVQIVLGRGHLWLPGVVETRKVPAERLHKAVKAIEPVTEWLDRWFHRRLPRLAGRVATRLAAACCTLLCLTVPPLEFVPFASTVPMVPIAIFGLAVTVRDGVLMLGGFLLTVAAFTIGVIAGA